MVTISLCMIVKDEEKTLPRCLSGVDGIADEIIIVDTGSTDRTKREAAAFTDQIYDFAWRDDFAAARNYAFSKASMEYCMWLDADDVIEEREREKLLNLKAELTDDTDVVMLRYVTACDEEGNPSFSFYRERIVKNDGRFVWKGRVHEAITPAGNILYADISVRHQKRRHTGSDRNLRIYESMLKAQEAFGPREQFYYGRELYDHGRWEDAARALLAFLEREEGFLENRIDACRLLGACRKRLGDGQGAFAALFWSFCYDVPRAEVCCDLGGLFLEANLTVQAVYWYERALGAAKREASGGFVEEDCYGYRPCIGLCIAYDRMGDHARAFRYNEKAATYKPGDKYVRANRRYFREKWGL
ncbi:MAG: glycosyltransferase family 2 protein [Eubacteriales bacterium]|nr:glycosyltransferase family 2 protein [Eubacteriales bacterium]